MGKRGWIHETEERENGGMLTQYHSDAIFMLKGKYKKRVVS